MKRHNIEEGTKETLQNKSFAKLRICSPITYDSHFTFMCDWWRTLHLHCSTRYDRLVPKMREEPTRSHRVRFYPNRIKVISVNVAVLKYFSNTMAQCQTTQGQSQISKNSTSLREKKPPWIKVPSHVIRSVDYFLLTLSKPLIVQYFIRITYL